MIFENENTNEGMQLLLITSINMSLVLYVVLPCCGFFVKNTVRLPTEYKSLKHWPSYNAIFIEIRRILGLPFGCCKFVPSIESNPIENGLARAEMLTKTETSEW
jgi:hypothetical protein